MAAGYDVDRFGSLTPRAYLLLMDAAADRAKREAMGQKTLAYNIAALTRIAQAGKLGPFEEVFPDRGPRPKQSREEITARLYALAAAWDATRDGL